MEESVDNTQREYPVARRAHRKSKRGCRSCKYRRVKCDEQRPVCGNCRTHFVNVQQCEYEEDRPGHPLRQASVAEGSRQDVLYKNSCEDGPDENVRIPSLRDLTTSAIDPFATHPESNERHLDRLINVYFSAQIFNVFPYYPTSHRNPVLENFVPLVWKDGVLFHVTLLLAAFHLETQTPGENRIQYAQLRSKCLQLLQDRINRPFPESISDETLSAVAGLATIEHEKGNPRLVDTHIDGLREMLKIRGGIAAVRKSNPVVAHMLFCLFTAAANGEFPDASFEESVPRPPWILKALEKETLETWIDFKSHGVTLPYAELMLNIRSLAQTYRTAQDCTTSDEYQNVLGFLCATLQRLLELPLPSSSQDGFVYEVSVTTACRHALVSHVLAQWCTCAPDPSLTVRAAQQGLLEALRPIVSRCISNKLVLWLLCVGASSAIVAAEKKWFMSHLVGVLDDLSIATWTELSTSLKKVIWHQYQDEPLYHRLWVEVLHWKGIPESSTAHTASEGTSEHLSYDITVG